MRREKVLSDIGIASEEAQNWCATGEAGGGGCSRRVEVGPLPRDDIMGQRREPGTLGPFCYLDLCIPPTFPGIVSISPDTSRQF